MKQITEKELGLCFDASQESDNIVFVIDSDKFNKFEIKKFSEKDTLKFINTATNDVEDVKFYTYNYENGESILTCGDVDVKLTNLKSSFFWNPESFKEIFGENSLIVGGQNE